MPAASVSLEEALDLTRTGDVWLFRGRTAGDRAIQIATNSPVNHVGMSVVIEDLPPLMWHAELGRSLPDVWSGTRQRGVQLHDLREAVLVWARRYGQRAWLRQLGQPVSREMEDTVLRTIARMDGTPFPSTTRLASQWVAGRLPAIKRTGRTAGLQTSGLQTSGLQTSDPQIPDPQTAYCAQVLAITFQSMGLLPAARRPNWYDAGRFWSGDDLTLSSGYTLGSEISVQIPAADPGEPGSSASGR